MQKVDPVDARIPTEPFELTAGQAASGLGDVGAGLVTVDTPVDHRQGLGVANGALGGAALAQAHCNQLPGLLNESKVDFEVFIFLLFMLIY